MTFVCKECVPEQEFQEMPENCVCPTCNSLVHIKEEAKVVTAPESPKVRGEYGLGIIVMDMSGSMEEVAFPEVEGYSITKAGVVASALSTSITKIKRINKADKAYVAIIGFTNDAKLLGIYKASEIDENVKYWDEWFRKNSEIVRNSYGGGTNITSALRLAREIYDAALEGDLSTYGVSDFLPMYQNININDNIYDIANIRVFIYSDGEHYADEYLVNYFENASLIPGQTNISGVTSAFLGNAEDDGYMNMRDIAGVCPKHNIKAVIHVNKPEAYDYLRDLFHMTSSTSGFCVECAKMNKRINFSER